MLHDRLNAFLVALAIGCIILATAVIGSPSQAKFDPDPNSPPVGTGGTGTRATPQKIFKAL